MYKSICVVAVLLAAFAFMSGSKPAGASAPTSYASPQIVARGKLANQTAPIPTTTIFTPVQTGLYRLSVYATISKADSNSGSDWLYSMEYADDSGPQALSQLLYGYNNTPGQFTLYSQFFNDAGGPTVTFEAKAGTPITYGVALQGPPDDSAYSLYYALERLE
jgi:hypothetical protein